jgi:hypothetical protein
MKKTTKAPQAVSDDYIRETKNSVILDLGKKVNFGDVRSHQQVRPLKVRWLDGILLEGYNSV